MKPYGIATDLYEVARETSNAGNAALASLFFSTRDILGIDLNEAYESLRPKSVEDSIERLKLGQAFDTAMFRDRIEAFIDARNKARSQRDYAEADRVRSLLSEAGVLLSDRGEATVWELGIDFDPAKLEALR